MKHAVSILIILLVCCSLYFTKKCTTHPLTIGEICTINALDVGSTQFIVGESEVQCNLEYLNSLSEADFVKYLEKSKNLSPAVIGPYGKLFITNGHHFTKSVIESKFPDDIKEIYVQITDNFSCAGSYPRFWHQMITSQYVWLYDEKGNQPINPMLLPSIANLVNDPYRSLAWLARHAGAFAKLDVWFQECMWANFFRENIPWNSDKLKGDPTSWNWCQASPYSYYECDIDENEQLQSILPFAVQLAKSAAADYLPGWGNGTVNPIDCSQGIEFD